MLTIGHSTLPIDVFLHALQQNRIDLLIDVRTVPRSRHNPQFATEALSASLAANSIQYRWMQALGGLRHAHKDSINTAWRNLSFRGYADYMQTELFQIALAELMQLDQENTAAIMCAEAVPWRCHRSLIGDALLVHGHPVQDIFVTPAGTTHSKPHALTAFARVEAARLWYPADAVQQELPLSNPGSPQSKRNPSS